MLIFETGAIVAVLAAIMSAFRWLSRSRGSSAPELGEISQQWLVQHRAHEREPRL